MMSALRWFFVVTWMGLIFFLSSVPGVNIPTGPEIISIIIHYIEYLVLALLLCWAINGGFKQPIHASVLISAFVITVFYGISDELHQLYVPGRVTDMMDLLVDGSGALTAVIAIVVFKRFHKSEAVQ